MAEEGEAVHLGHSDVGEDEIDGLFEDEIVGDLSVCGLLDDVALLGEELGERLAEDGFVFDDQEGLAHHL